MNARIGIIALFALALWWQVAAGADSTMLIGGHPVPLGPVGSANSSQSSQIPAPRLSVQSSASSQLETLYKDVPSISGRYSVGGTIMMPYAGVGFNGGYATDLDRSLHSAPTTQTDPNLRSPLGQNLAPSEFQMGVRIPF